MMCSQQRGRLGIDRDAPLLARLGLLLLDAGLGLRIGPLHDHCVRREVDVPSAQGADLAPAHAADHHDPQE
jgi:hypothetical protein